MLLPPGLEVTMRPYPAFPSDQTNSLETVRGAASSLLDRGADRIYLFNFMDSQTAMDDLASYPTVLREAGHAETLAGKPRRHVLTCPDLWAPGETRAIPLPAAAVPPRWMAFRVPTGPRPLSGSRQVRLGINGISPDQAKNWEVRVNGDRCAFVGTPESEHPRPKDLLFAFQIPATTLNAGYNLVEVLRNRLQRSSGWKFRSKTNNRP